MEFFLGVMRRHGRGGLTVEAETAPGDYCRGQDGGGLVAGPQGQGQRCHRGVKRTLETEWDLQWVD